MLWCEKMEVPENRKWMYKRTYPGPGLRPLNPEFIKGLDGFMNYGRQSSIYLSEGTIRCPCVKCGSRKFLKLDDVEFHLLKNGFKPDYWYWTDHGEVAPNPMSPRESIDENHVLGEGNVVDRHQNMVDDATTNVPGSHTQANTRREASKPQNKTLIEPDGDFGFLPSKPAATAIAKVIQSKYDHPWPSWGKIPKSTREAWFKEFQGHVWWMPQHHARMWKAYNSRSSKRLSDLLAKARELNERPLWIVEGVWEDLCRHWDTSAYKEKCQKAKRNRASDPEKCVHTGGCISKGTHALKLAKARDREPAADETDGKMKKARVSEVGSQASRSSNKREESSSSGSSASSLFPEHFINQVKEQLPQVMEGIIQKEIQQMRQEIDSRWKRRFEKYQRKQEKRLGNLLKSYLSSTTTQLGNKVTDKDEGDGHDEDMK